MNKCKRCKYSWFPRQEARARWCPSCHSPYWDKDKVRGVVVSAVPVKVSRVPGVAVAIKPEPAKIVEPKAGCKCGATGVMLVGGKRCCAKCGRSLGD